MVSLVDTCTYLFI